MIDAFRGSIPVFNRRASVMAVLLLGLLACAAFSRCDAQVTTGDIVGTVTDKTGAVVPGAVVTITDTDTQAVRTATATPQGDFVFTFLQPGNYKVVVTAPNFEQYTATNISLSAGARERVDAALTVGAASQSVEVNAGGGNGMQTDSSTVQSAVTEKAVQDLPLNGRNFINLVQLAPGVNAGNPSGIPAGGAPDDRRQSSSVVANGQSYLENNQLIDGLDNNEREQGVIGVRPSIDAISEIRVITSNYPAEVGRAAGAVVNVITKAGTNSFHGGAFEFFRNDIFDGRNFFSRTGPKPELRQNQFGGSLGGPIVKNKMFFFVAAEDLREIEGTTYTDTIPTLFEQQNPGNFSDIGGPVVPSGSISPVALNFFKLYPAPNQAPQAISDGVPLDNFSFSPNKTFYGLTLDGRFDWQLNPNNSVFVHYGYNPVSVNTPGKLPGAAAFGTTVYSGGVDGFTDVFANINGTSQITAQGVDIDYVHIFSPRFVMELKTGFTRINIQSVPLDYGTNLGSKFGLVNSNLGTPDTSGLASMLFFSGPYASLGDGYFVPILNRNNNFQYNGTATYTTGPHSIKFGAALIRRQLNYFQDQFSPQGGFAFDAIPPYLNAEANFLAGSAEFVQRGNLLVNPGYRMWEPSAFVQDDWRASSNLTLNLGIRYDVLTPFTEAHNNYSNFNASTLQVQIAGQTTSPTLGIGTHYLDFSPRVGFALSLPKNTVVRGGFGIGFFPVDFQNTIQNANPPYSFLCFPCFTTSFPTLPIPTSPSVTNPAGTVTSKNPHFGPAYNEQFNLTIQKQLGASVLTATYVGELGRKLLYQGDLDRPLPPGPGNPTPPYNYQTQLPNVTSIAYNYNGAVMNYNALQISFDRHYQNGLTFATNYTLAHGLIDGSPTGTSSDPPDLVAGDVAYDYGNSNIDIRQRFSATVNYELPFGKSSHGLKAAAIKQWQFNVLGYWQTGLPFTVENSTPQINVPGVSDDRPDRIAKASLSNPTINEWFNTSAFAAQTYGTAGNSERNGYYGPHDRRADMSLFKNFALKEDLQLQFRAECFNVSNTPNFGQPQNIGSLPVSPAPAGTLLGGAGYGAITGTNPVEIPRQWQFALKLQF